MTNNNWETLLQSDDEPATFSLDEDGNIVTHPAVKAAYAAHQRGRLWERSGLRTYEQQIAFGDFKSGGRPATQQMLKAITQLINGAYSWVVVSGGVGVGKTMALMATVNAFVQNGRPAKYLLASDLMLLSPEEQRQALPELIDIDLLVIDELDKLHMLFKNEGAGSDNWTTTFISALIDKRYRAAHDVDAGRKYTMIAMNTAPSELPPQLASRLTDSSDPRFVYLRNNDPDWRNQ